MPEVEYELYKLITVGGTDAVDFLQGQLTQDVRRVDQTSPLRAAWCNPKGRVIVTLHLIALDNLIGLVIPAATIDNVLRRLAMYRLRSDVEFYVADKEWMAHIGRDDADPASLILSGVPTIDETNSESYTPHMLNLDKLGAISFTKGCYTGQEVVARTENLGKSKRRLMRYRADDGGISVGDKLSDGGRDVGAVVNVFGRDLLAVTPVDLHNQSLMLNGSIAAPLGLPYEL